MKKTTLYSLYKKAKIELEEPQTSHITNNFAGTNCKLSIEEEKLIIEYIEERQRNFDCLSIKELCSYATHLMKMRNPEAEDLSYSWWKSFKKRHSSVLTTKMVDSRELSRTKVKYDEVIEYYGKIVHALAHINSHKQIINMGETVFASQSEKGCKKKCVSSLLCCVLPKFKEEKHFSHLSVVVAINMYGEILMLLFITKEQVKLNNSSIQIINNYAKFASTNKGYMDSQTMIYWIHEILYPYCQRIWDELNNPNAPIYLIIDNCPSHSSQEILIEFQKIINFEIIWLPPNSTHFLEQLDSLFFSVMKSYYRSGNIEKTKPLVTGKIIRAFKALWSSANPLTIIKCWELTGFKFHNFRCLDMHVPIDISMVNEIIRANIPEYNNEETSEWNL